MHLDHLLTGAHLLARPGSAPPRPDAAVGVRDGRIAWVGSSSEAISDLGAHLTAANVVDIDGRLVTPALVDCHTHLVFAGSRAGEWERRLAGESYADIARRGGGIRATVAATRGASLDELVEGTARRLEVLAAEGVGTVEIKSGYGLDPDTELRMLEAASRAGEVAGVNVERTLLAAHAVPPEYDGRSDAYLDEVVVPLVARCGAEGLADAVDAFCEEIAFDAGQLRRVFEAAHRAGLPVKLHADQLGDGGGAALAAEFAALSADHLEFADPGGLAAMAGAGTVAVLLPGAWVHLGGGRRPPVTTMREAGVTMAVATDANPGSSPLLSLLTAAHLGCSAFGLTVDEALAGITGHAARALGLDDRGALDVGMRADLAVWNAGSPAELLQWIGARPLHRRMMGGRWS